MRPAVRTLQLSPLSSSTSATSARLTEKSAGRKIACWGVIGRKIGVLSFVVFLGATLNCETRYSTFPPGVAQTSSPLRQTVNVSPSTGATSLTLSGNCTAACRVAPFISSGSLPLTSLISITIDAARFSPFDSAKSTPHRGWKILAMRSYGFSRGAVCCAWSVEARANRKASMGKNGRMPFYNSAMQPVAKESFCISMATGVFMAVL